MLSAPRSTQLPAYSNLQLHRPSDQRDATRDMLVGGQTWASTVRRSSLLSRPRARKPADRTWHSPRILRTACARSEVSVAGTVPQPMSRSGRQKVARHLRRPPLAPESSPVSVRTELERMSMLVFMLHEGPIPGVNASPAVVTRAPVYLVSHEGRDRDPQSDVGARRQSRIDLRILR